LLQHLKAGTTTRRKLRKLRTGEENTELGYIVRRAEQYLTEYIGDVEGHLRSVPLRERFTDREILASREQYLLYMLEFELVNRLHREQFLGSGYRIALLPYCLKESHSRCKASPDDVDMVCRNCIKSCFINRLSTVLREHDINPYILSRGRIRNLLKGLYEKHGSLGVMGVACIVELVMGMRLCMQAGIPVVGIPLNANRCPRWMGSMHETSIDLSAVRRLVSVDKSSRPTEESQ
jgi:hypothetical protein